VSTASKERKVQEVNQAESVLKVQTVSLNWDDPVLKAHKVTTVLQALVSQAGKVIEVLQVNEVCPVLKVQEVLKVLRLLVSQAIAQSDLVHRVLKARLVTLKATLSSSWWNGASKANL